jgi:UDP-N-acetylmuramate dehydrogenase
LEPDGTLSEWPPARLEYGYRTSLLKRQPADGPRAVVLGAEFVLRPGDREALDSRVAEIQTRRKATQPPGASCGSVFKNPPGNHAGRLIEAAGLKGTVRGGAQISTVHANFIINQRGATARDIKSLIDLARQTVEDQAGVRLELEVELVGDW